jgi:hypothetical protein
MSAATAATRQARRDRVRVGERRCLLGPLDLVAFMNMLFSMPHSGAKERGEAHSRRSAGRACRSN